MEEKEKQTATEKEQGGLKGFFKKVKSTLEKLDKKLDETMDNDPLMKKDEEENN